MQSVQSRGFSGWLIRAAWDSVRSSLSKTITPMLMGLSIGVLATLPSQAQNLGPDDPLHPVDYSIPDDGLDGKRLIKLKATSPGQGQTFSFDDGIQISDPNTGNGSRAFNTLILNGNYQDLLNATELPYLLFYGDYDNLEPRNIAGGSGQAGEPYTFAGISIGGDALSGEIAEHNATINVIFLPQEGTINGNGLQPINPISPLAGKPGDGGYGRIIFLLQSNADITPPEATCFQADGQDGVFVPAGETCYIPTQTTGLFRSGNYTSLTIKPEAAVILGEYPTATGTPFTNFIINDPDTGEAPFTISLEGGSITEAEDSGNGYGIDASNKNGNVIVLAQNSGTKASEVTISRYIGSRGDDLLLLYDDTSFVVSGRVSLNGSKIFNELRVLDQAHFESESLEATGSTLIYNSATIKTGAIQWSGDDNDMIENRGLIQVDGAITMDGGNDQISNIGSATLKAASISMGSGDDVIINEPNTLATNALQTTAGDINLGLGNDVVVTNQNIGVSGVLDGGGANSQGGIQEGITYYSQGNDNYDVLIFTGPNTTESRSTRLTAIPGNKLVHLEEVRQKSGNWIYQGSYGHIPWYRLQGGSAVVDEQQLPTFDRLELEGSTLTYLKSNENEQGLVVNDRFVFRGGGLVIDGRSVSDTTDRSWPIIQGLVINGEELASNTQLLTTSADTPSFQFTGLASTDNATNDGDSGTVAVYPFTYAYLNTTQKDKSAKGRSQNFSVELIAKTPICDLDPTADDCDDDGGEETIQPPIPPFLPGCAKEELCSIPPDPWLPLLPDFPAQQLPPFFDYGQLARLVASGLTPRNVNAAGRGLQTYNNQLADAVLERHPLRQFRRTSEVNKDQTSDNQDPLGQDKETWVELPSLPGQYADRDRWRAWSRGFGGNRHSNGDSTIANDYTLSSGGMALGADVSLSESFQVGAYANYGAINVHQQGITGGGGWNPNGWGGGITADLWGESVYLQGVLGVSAMAGEQRRGLLSITEGWGNSTARTEKTATTWIGALRIGAPIQTGNTYLEPQLTGLWTHNEEHGSSEHGVQRALQLNYRSRSTDYLQTALGVKAAWPINSGTRAQWVPSLRVAWLSDWDLGNSSQTVGYTFTNTTVDFNPDDSTLHGALIEVGVDYTVANGDATSFKLYLRGGAELWGGDRVNSWLASGGVTLQF